MCKRQLSLSRTALSLHCPWVPWLHSRVVTDVVSMWLLLECGADIGQKVAECIWHVRHSQDIVGTLCYTRH